jgi:hypothetical protein
MIKEQYPMAGERLYTADEVRELQKENERVRAALAATWEALDGLYGADIGEDIPIDLLPEDRQELFHKALELVGEALE